MTTLAVAAFLAAGLVVIAVTAWLLARWVARAPDARDVDPFTGVELADFHREVDRAREAKP
jgi:hypothetical protein